MCWEQRCSLLQTVINMIRHSRQSTLESPMEKGHESEGVNCRLQVAGCRLQVAGCRLQVAGADCRLQVQVAGCGL